MFDAAGQVKEIYHRNAAGTVLSAFTYVYDNAGNRSYVTEPGGTVVTWGYDNAYQLTSERRFTGGTTHYSDTFTYDDAGNRKTNQTAAASITTFNYDAANQLTTSVLGTTTTTYTYDNNGNLQVENVLGTRTTYTWDDENRMTGVDFATGTDNAYSFNGDGQRVQVVDSQGTKKPIWDGQNILVEQNSSNVTQVVYTLQPAGYGNLLSQKRSSTKSLFLFDALGSTRKLLDTSAVVTDSYDFKAFGETYASTGSTTNVFRWVGKLGYYYDIDRLAYYLRARAYSPKLARFLSYDPLGFVDAVNLFRYVGNRVMLLVDPSGRETESGTFTQSCECECNLPTSGTYKQWITTTFDDPRNCDEVCGDMLGRPWWYPTGNYRCQGACWFTGNSVFSVIPECGECDPQRQYCHEEYIKCLHTKLADKSGGNRCEQCLDKCNRKGQPHWPGRSDGCDYWNYPSTFTEDKPTTSEH